MNILYLLKVLDTNKLSELVKNMELPPLDINLALWDAVDAGEIEINQKKDRVKALKEADPWRDADLANKLIRVVQHYARDEANVTVGRMHGYIKDPLTEVGYKVHEYLMTMQYLIDSGQVIEMPISVPKTAKRPYQKFVFLCLPENAEHNEEWNARVVNKWIDNWKPSKVK